METNNTWRNTIIYFIGRNISSIVGILLIPLYTKYLNPQDYGIYSVIFVVINLTSIIIDFGLASSFSIRFYKITLAIRAAYINKIFYSYILSVLLFGFLFYFLGDKIFNLGDAANKNLLLIIILIIFFNLHFAFFTNLLRIEGLAKLYVIITSISTIILSTLNILFIVHYKLTYKSYLFSYLFNGIFFYIIAMFYVFKNYKISNKEFSLNSITPLFMLGVPMLISLLTGQILTSGDQYLLGRMSSFSDVGIYAVGYKIGMLFYSFIIISFFQAYPPEAYRIYSEDLDQFRNTQVKALNIFNILIVVLSLTFLLVLPYIFKLLVNEKYIMSIQIVPTILLSYLFLGYANVFTVVIIIQEKVKILMVLTIIVTAVNIILNIIFIPRFTYYAAAFNTLISYFIFLILSYRYAQKIFFINYQYQSFIFSLVLIVFAWLINTILFYYVKSFLLITGFNTLFVASITIYIIIRYDVKKYIIDFNFKTILRQYGFLK